jgi:hypothetical protein
MAKLAELWTSSAPERDTIVIDGKEFEVKSLDDLSFDDQLVIARNARVAEMATMPNSTITGKQLREALVAIARTLLLDNEKKELVPTLESMKDMALVQLFNAFLDGATFKALQQRSTS